MLSCPSDMWSVATDSPQRERGPLVDPLPWNQRGAPRVNKRNVRAGLALLIFTVLILLCPEWSSKSSAAIVLQAQSAGLLDAGGENFARLYVNGTNHSLNQSGINLVVVDESTGEVLDQDTFTGWNHYLSNAAAARAEFSNYVASIQSGRRVMLAVRDDAWASWGFGSPDHLAELSMILESLGASATNMTDIGFRGSYALIGTKGGAVGSGEEATGTRTGSPVSVSTTIDVGDPLADFLMSSPTGQRDELIQFDGSLSSHTNPSSSLLSYHWDFGDGSMQTLSSPIISHAYSQAGLYDVTLTVTDLAGQSASTTQQFQANAVPEPTSLAAFGVLFVLGAVGRRRKAAATT